MKLSKITAAVLLAALLGDAGSVQGGAGPVADPAERPAVRHARSMHAVMLAVAKAGKRLVAVGERGVVLFSDDAGASWQQADVPVAVTLTALCFTDSLRGWAVGHAGVVLATSDGGKTWRRQLQGRQIAQLELEAARAGGDGRRIAQAERLVADGADKPLLTVHFWDDRRGIAVGAYGLIVGTEDGGASWQSWLGRAENPKGLHLNAIHVVGPNVYLAGEQGLLLKSTDDARSFQSLASPYKGSWFAITGQGDQLVIGGLRGNVFWSNDGGRQWVGSQVPVPVSIAAATAMKSGALVFVNQAGQLLSSTDGGRTLLIQRRPPGPPITALAESDDGSLVVGTFSGMHRVPKTPTDAIAGR